MENSEPRPPQLKYVLILIAFVVGCAFIVGFLQGLGGEEGSTARAFRFAGLNILLYGGLAFVAMVAAMVMNRFGLADNWSMWILLPLMLGGLQASGEALHGSWEMAGKSLLRGASTGLLIAVGIHWANRKGWISTAVKQPRIVNRSTDQSTPDGTDQ